jgi:hypothetical protein
MLRSVVIIRVPICTKDNSLANKVKRVRTAAKAAIDRIKVVLYAKLSDCSIVIRGVVKYKIT